MKSPLGVGTLLLAACSLGAAQTVEPQLIHEVLPHYPIEALAGEVEGFVELLLTITPQGTVADVVVVRAEPPGVFEQAAVEAVRQWRYRPRPVSSEPALRERVRATVRFDLPGPTSTRPLRLSSTCQTRAGSA